MTTLLQDPITPAKVTIGPRQRPDGMVGSRERNELKQKAFSLVSLMCSNAEEFIACHFVSTDKWRGRSIRSLYLVVLGSLRGAQCSKKCPGSFSRFRSILYDNGQAKRKQRGDIFNLELALFLPRSKTNMDREENKLDKHVVLSWHDYGSSILFPMVQVSKMPHGLQLRQVWDICKKAGMVSLRHKMIQDTHNFFFAKFDEMTTHIASIWRYYILPNRVNIKGFFSICNSKKMWIIDKRIILRHIFAGTPYQIFCASVSLFLALERRERFIIT